MTRLLDGPYPPFEMGRTYDVSPDGQRFLVVRPAGDAAGSEIHVVLNWFEELERLVPTEN